MAGEERLIQTDFFCREIITYLQSARTAISKSYYRRVTESRRHFCDIYTYLHTIRYLII